MPSAEQEEYDGYCRDCDETKEVQKYVSAVHAYCPDCGTMLWPSKEEYIQDVHASERWARQHGLGGDPQSASKKMVTDGGTAEQESADVAASTISSEGDIVLSAPHEDLAGNWNSELGDGEVASFDAALLPDDIEEKDRIYIEREGLLVAQTTVREVGEETVWATGIIPLRVAADCPVDTPETGSTRLNDGGILDASDRNISSDTVADTEGFR